MKSPVQRTVEPGRKAHPKLLHVVGRLIALRRCAWLAIASVALGAPLLAETQIGTAGPFTWSENECGEQVTVSVKVYKDVEGSPGLYRWDYEVRNISLLTQYGVLYPQSFGLGEVDLYLPSEMPEIQNPVVANEGWSGYATYADLGDGRSTSAVVVLSNSTTVLPGETLRFSFFTAPRVTASLDACVSTDYGYMDPCGVGIQPGLIFERGQARMGGHLGARGRRPVSPLRPRRSGGHNASCNESGGMHLTGSIAVPGNLRIALDSFQWSYTKDDANPSHVMQVPIYRTWPDWTLDTLADEGLVEVADPGWTAWSDETQGPYGDPVAYTSETAPAIKSIRVVLPDGAGGGTFDARLLVTSDNPAFVFDSVPIQFSNGVGTLLAQPGQSDTQIQSTVALPAGFVNTQVALTWSMSLDDGNSYVDFATTTHRILATPGRAEGFAGYRGIPASLHVTARRLDFVTQVFAQTPDDDSVIALAAATMLDRFGFGDNGFPDKDPPTIWSVLDQAFLSSGLEWEDMDCISLTALSVVPVLQAGAKAAMSLAFPTPDGDASFQRENATDILGYYTSEGELNWFEAYLMSRVHDPSGDVRQAFTVMPPRDRQDPQPLGSVIGLPNDTWKRLAFTVIRFTLDNERSGVPFSGEQWWVVKTTLQRLELVPFPQVQ